MQCTGRAIVTRVTRSVVCVSVWLCVWHTVEPREMGARLISGPTNHVLDGGTHWCHLANTIEQSVPGGDAALCQVTFTAC